MNAGNLQNMVLYFATDQVTTITITISGSSYTQTLTSGAVPTVLTSAIIPKTGAQDARLTTESLSPENKGIHIVSTKPIVAYAHIYNMSVSGASILFPTNTLGKEYYSINFTNNSNTANANCWMYVLATDTGFTVVEITPSVKTLFHPAGVPFQVTLKQGQVYNLMAETIGFSSGDLTGSTIKSISVGSVGCKKIAVFSGSGRISITCNGTTSSSDNYMVQAFPKNAWGKKYLTATTSGTQTFNIFRICVTDPTTIVTLNGAPITLPLINNFYYEVPATSAPLRIEADKSIIVSQYTTSQGACGNGSPGDPEVIYLSAVEQSISKVLWNATPNFNITQHFYNVIIPNTGTAISSFKLDGISVSPSLFIVHPQDPAYSYLKQSVSSGSHSISSDSGFNAIAYGFGSAESYGYNAGTNVKDLFQQIGVSSQYGIETTPSVCKGSPFKFKISLPYQPDSMYWDFNNPPTVPPILNVNQPGPLVFDSVRTINSRTVWWYSLPGFYTFNTVGIFPITITTYRQNNEGCGNVQEIDFDLEVSDPPVAGISAPDSVCDGSQVQFTDATISVKPTYLWNWNFGDPASGATNTSNLKNPVHIFSGPGTYTVSYSNITTPGCLSDTIQKQITVNALPSSSLSGSTTVCVNSTPPDITFTGIGAIAPYTFTYKLNGGPIQIISTTGTNTSVTLPVPTGIAGTYTYILETVTDGSTTLCTRAQLDTAIVIVNPVPTASIAGNTTVCQNATPPVITFTAASGAAPYTFTYNINGGADLTVTTTSGNSVQVIVPTATPGTYIYSLTSVQGGSSTLCSQAQTGSASVTITDLPTATISGTTEVCLNGTSPSVTFTGSGNTGPYTFTYNINGGANITVTGTGNTAIVNPPTNVAGTFTYNLVSVTDASANLCSQAQTGSTVITVNPLPVADFTTGTISCEGKDVNFTDISIPNAGLLSEWTWDFGDPASGAANTSAIQNPIHIFSSAGTYTVTLLVKTDKGCISPVVSKLVVVNAKPLAGFIDPEVCLSDSYAQFTDTSSVVGGTITSWLWNFDDLASGTLNTSTVQNPQHSYSTTGLKNVSLYATSDKGCIDTVVQSFVVNGDVPIANFNLNNPGSICAYDSVAIQNTSTINVGSIIKVEIYWDNTGAPTVFDTDLDPLPNKIYKHLYPMSQVTKTYNVRYRVYSGATCINEVIKPIIVNAVPSIQFNAIPNVCLDATPFQITQASETGGVTQGPAPTFSGPGVTSTGIFNPASVGPGVYTIKYTFISNMGCMDVDSQDIRVLQPPVANFKTVGAACEDQSLIFEDQSTSSVGTITSWSWDFADGTPVVIRNSPAPFPHTFINAGTYLVKLIITTSDGCKQTFPLSVIVSTKPVPGFSFPAVACLPNAVINFSNGSSAGTYSWDFGDPGSGIANTSTALNPSHSYSTQGPFNVNLQVQNAAGCFHDTTIVVNTIHPQPKSDFSTNKPGVCLGEAVNFQDMSNPADGTTSTWQWDFGDGTTSSLPAPTHLYQSANSYNVSLYITNSLGCNSDTIKKVYTVYPFPTVDAGADIFVLEDGSVTLQPVITGSELTYLWTPNIYLNNNTIATPVTTPDDDILYTITATSKGGCSASDQVFVKVLLGPKIPNTFTPNNDGRNDTWVIEYLDTYPKNKVQVFTRTGQLIFESRGYKTPWDGTLKGKPLPMDTYYYIIEPENGRKPITGYVTILK
ncbi:MAG: PKD domain-containing protein [Ferruginibacter sp.]